MTRNAWRSFGGGAALIVLLTVVAYIPAMRGGFVFDDHVLIQGNWIIKARDGLHRFWFTTQAPDYYPMTWSLWWLEWRWWGDNAAGYHVVNVLLHALNAILVWIILRRLKIPGAWLAGLVFAIHPVNVATAAWISEQKNTLSMLFYAAAIILYLRFDEEGRWRWYGFALAAFLLALLSKTAIVMLPVVLLLCVWWRRGRVRWNDVLRSLPFFVLSLVSGLATIWFQHYRALRGHTYQTESFAARLATAGCAPWFYWYKAILPFDLSAVYPKWHIDAADWLSYLPGMALVGCFVVLWRARGTWGRPLLFAFGYYVVTLFPVLGFFEQGFYRYSFVADQWQYPAIAAPIALAVAAAASIFRRMGEQHRLRERLAGIAVVIALGAATGIRGGIYADDETLWRDTLAKNPQGWIAHTNLGFALWQAGKVPEAVVHWEQALRINPNSAETHNDMGMALAQAGRTQDAINHFERALQIKPDYADAHNNLGLALAQAGRIQDAIGQFELALSFNVNDVEAHSNLGMTLARAGRFPEAIGRFEQALQIDSNYAEVHNNLALALWQVGRVQDAIRHWEQALRIKPDLAAAHRGLGDALFQAGKLREAIGHYEQALRIEPGVGDVQNRLAWLLATLVPAEGGDPGRAVTLAQQVCERTSNRVATYLDTLAAAYAAANRFDEAIATARKAIELARADKQPTLVAEIEARLQLYRDGRAYHTKSL